MKEKVHFALAFSDILCSFSGLASVLGRRIFIVNLSRYFSFPYKILLISEKFWMGTILYKFM